MSAIFGNASAYNDGGYDDSYGGNDEPIIEQTDEELVEEAKLCSGVKSEKVIGIIEFYQKKNYLTAKQRHCLESYAEAG